MLEAARSFMTLYYNHNMVMGKGSNTVTPQDFWKLSYDKQEEEAPELNKEEKLKNLMALAERAKKRIKNG